jgi:hypothetical protein
MPVQNPDFYITQEELETASPMMLHTLLDLADRALRVAASQKRTNTDALRHFRSRIDHELWTRADRAHKAKRRQITIPFRSAEEFLNEDHEELYSEVAR